MTRPDRVFFAWVVSCMSLGCASQPTDRPEVVVTSNPAAVQGCMLKGSTHYNELQVQGTSVRVPELARRASKLGGNVILTLPIALPYSSPDTAERPFGRAEVYACHPLPSLELLSSH